MKLLSCNYYNLPHSPYFLQEGKSSAAACNVGFLFHCFHHVPLLPKALHSFHSPVNVLEVCVDLTVVSLTEARRIYAKRTEPWFKRKGNES